MSSAPPSVPLSLSPAHSLSLCVCLLALSLALPSAGLRYDAPHIPAGAVPPSTVLLWELHRTADKRYEVRMRWWYPGIGGVGGGADPGSPQTIAMHECRSGGACSLDDFNDVQVCSASPQRKKTLRPGWHHQPLGTQVEGQAWEEGSGADLLICMVEGPADGTWMG